jgi:hypothetical protein
MQGHESFLNSRNLILDSLAFARSQILGARSVHQLATAMFQIFNLRDERRVLLAHHAAHVDLRIPVEIGQRCRPKPQEATFLVFVAIA